ncbi:MAG: tetratricopeptide repeat protein [Dehalococcoidia bacterium]|nr:tetratricopeptide repeat protein [Dehalococcoidia bacterium]
MRIEELLERATAASQGGRREEARDLLVDVLAAYPNNLEAWLRLADLASSPDRASLYYRRASEIDPLSLRAQKGLEATLTILGAAGEPERPSQGLPCAIVPPEDESRTSPRGVRPAVAEAPPDSPIFVDNESAPFTVDLGPRANASGKGVVPGPWEGRRERPDGEPEHPLPLAETWPPLPGGPAPGRIGEIPDTWFPGGIGG